MDFEYMCNPGQSLWLSTFLGHVTSVYLLGPYLLPSSFFCNPLCLPLSLFRELNSVIFDNSLLSPCVPSDTGQDHALRLSPSRERGRLCQQSKILCWKLLLPLFWALCQDNWSCRRSISWIFICAPSFGIWGHHFDVAVLKEVALSIARCQSLSQERVLLIAFQWQKQVIN